VTVEFRVLGTVEAVADGRTLPLGGGRERAVLARLLAGANQVVAQDTLVDDLWPGEAPEAGGASALQAYVYRLRKLLRRAGGEDLVRTRAPGYLIAVEADLLDATRFQGLVRAAHEFAHREAHNEAAAALAEALALWRGPAYHGLGELPFAAAAAARLEEARLAALEARIEADLACGRDRELIGELAALTTEYALRERLWALRMTALYRAGRQTEALRAYQELRDRLREELGLEPATELRELEGAILRQDPQLARPDPLITELRAVKFGQTAPDERAQIIDERRAAAVVPGPASGPGVVTFMFTDLVGSTEMLDRLGDDAADALRRRHFTALREALSAHGGAEVKNLGDGLMAWFTSPAAAVRCAVTIQQGAVGDGGEKPPAVRVGIHAGEPIAEEDDFFGTPVVVAQRLCARAEGGQILVSTLVQGLVGTRAGCAFEPLGPLLLKGLAVPVEACAVRWVAPEVTPALPLPGALANQDSLFVRPEADMSRLEAAWAAARSGRRQLVMLAGEPGIGKTRRSAELARTAHAAGAVVLHGRCDDGLALPYQPVVEALGTYLRHTAAPVLGRLGGELTRLVPELATRLPELPAPMSADPETERYRLFDAVAAWLAALAEATPTVLVVEDIHWATPPTLALLTHLVRSGEPGRLLLLVNYRDTALDVTPALADAVADLLRQPDVDRLSLTGFDRDGVSAYLQARAGGVFDRAGPRLAERLHAETAGNPYYLSELLRHLGETGALTEGGWAAAAGAGSGVPESVRDVIARRVSRLPDATRDVLALAAIQGDRFDPTVLAEASDLPYVDVLAALDAACAARLVAETDGPPAGYRFVHALVRHTVSDGLGAARRMQLHRATGAALAAVTGDSWREHAADLARHWLAATPPAGAGAEEVGRTLDYAQEAAGRAAAALAYEEAAAILGRSVPLLRQLDDPARRAELLVSLGEAQHHAGEAAHRATLREAAGLALDLRLGVLAERAVLANLRPVNVLAAVDPDRVGLLECVLDCLGPADTAARARVLAALASELHHTADPRRHDLAREAITVARRLDDPICLGRVLAVAGFSLWGPHTLAERVAIAAELGALAEPLGEPVLQIDAGLALYYAAAQDGNFDRARAGLASATRLAEDLGQPAMRLRALLAQQSCAMLEGRFADFKRHAAQALRFGEALGNPDAPGILHGDGATARLLLGHFDEAAEGLDAARAALRLPTAFSHSWGAWIYAEAGRQAEARALLAELGCPSLEQVPHNYARLAVLTFLAGAAGALEDRDLAARLYPELLLHADQFVLAQVSALGPVAHYLGALAAVLGWVQEADAHLRHAAELAERTRARGLLVRTRLEWARVSLTRGDSRGAAALAGAAQELATELDAPELARQAAELLHRIDHARRTGTA
jgi:DNA-binding SARP family transcriptional activator